MQALDTALGPDAQMQHLHGALRAVVVVGEVLRQAVETAWHDVHVDVSCTAAADRAPGGER